MEDQVQSVETTGVESASVAGEQVTETVETSVEPKTGTETSEVVAQVKDEKDFSAALKAREAQLRQQMEKEYGERAGLADTYQQKLDRIAKHYGFDSHDDYMNALEQHEREQEIQREAERLGVPEDFIRSELAPLKSQLQQLEQERQRYQQAEQIRQIDAEVSRLSQQYPDFEVMKNEVFQYAIDNHLKLEHAYRLLTYDNKIQQTAKQKEQEVLANVAKRNEKHVLPSHDGASNTAFGVADMSLSDIQKISERVRRGERITF